jgi:hypothetical protein
MPESTLSSPVVTALACAALIVGAAATAGAAHASGPAKPDTPRASPVAPRGIDAIAARVRVVRPDGRVGPLRVLRSTEEAVRARAGTPMRVLGVDGGATWLGYRHGDFFVRASGRTSRLVAFRTYSATWRTGRGTRVGMTLAAARRREGVAPVPAAGCVDRALIRVSGATRLFVGIAQGRVALLYVGPARGGVPPCVAP